MAKKKSIWSFALAMCLVLTAMFSLCACDLGTIKTLTGTDDIVAQGEFKKGTTLSANKISADDSAYTEVITSIADEEFDEDKVAVFNISLKNSENAKVQPDGKVKITMPKPFESENGFVTFHIKSDNSVEALETTVSGENIEFETESFSYFIIAGNLPMNPPTPPEEAPVTQLQLQYESAGFVDGSATYTIGETNKPRPNDVVVYGVTTDGNKLLTLDTDYTINLGGLDFEQAGTYTITYTYIKNFEVKATLTINVVAGSSEVAPTISFSNTHAGDSLEHLYNGTAVFVSKQDIMIDGTPLSEITDEELLSKITYVWRDRNTKVVVTPDADITLNGEINNYYGAKREITIGYEIAGPCVVGEYQFVLSYESVEKLVVDATITQSSFQKITSISDFDGTSAPTIFGEICYYTIVGYANGQMFVMQMPNTQDPADPATDEQLDAEARLITAQDNGSLTLGDKFDFVFTPMRYYESEWKYYPETSTSREDLLVDFCTGYYGARTTTINLATPAINRIGWTKLSGNQIVRVKGDYVGANYGNLTKFAEDGAVTIYAPRKGETENNALRLVKDGDKYVFTGKDKTTDTRESFPIYVYKYFVKQAEKFEFYNKLDKEYDGNAVEFNYYKDFYMETESGEDVGAMLKMETIKFVFRDMKDNFVMDGIINQGDGTVTGPSEVGDYRLVVQFLENGKTWVDKAILNEFHIYLAS